MPRGIPNKKVIPPTVVNDTYTIKVDSRELKLAIIMLECAARLMARNTPCANGIIAETIEDLRKMLG